MPEWVLELNKVSKAFPGTQALNEVNLSLKAGEIHALIGENGAGKSTLMKILVGIHKMDSGEIIVNGEKVDINSPHNALLKGISIVPQEINLIPEVSVAENIFLGNEKICKKKGFIDWNLVKKHAEEQLKKLGIKIDVSERLANLSAAYQQLVSIARSLAGRAQILILDEPTASLTLKETELLFNVMKKLQSNGTSIIFISHHLEEIKEITDRITIMRDGEVVHRGDTKDLSINDMIFYMANRKVEKKELVKRQFSNKVFLEVKDLSRNNEFENISFRIHKGEILGIAGLVGSGRTELFKTIYGVSKKEKGKAYIEGKEVNIERPSDAIGFGIGYVPEERRNDGIFPILTLYENMMMPSYKKYSKSGIIRFDKVKNLANQYIDKLRVKTPSNDKMIKDLSGGNQQKVIIARWMAKGVKMLILDEPTQGIDVNAKGEIHKFIRQMADEGIAVIVISSEIEEVLSLSDRIMVMHEGRTKGFVESPEDLDQQDILEIALQ